MKANAPEKIYIDANEDWHRTHSVFIEKAKGNDIEYTRTDALIEKAVSYIQRHWIWNTKMIENFKKYMKGENE